MLEGRSLWLLAFVPAVFVGEHLRPDRWGRWVFPLAVLANFGLALLR